ncbi:MAG TPA: LuxR C-terminal-related transcriptional regulator [Polyangiaceae bacterium]|nr:LuxR C-terminal-related transcriptional regulator [Polyangiaceae bacterium]
MGNLVDYLGVGVLAFRREIIVFANAALARPLGYSSSMQLLGRSIWQLIHPDAHEAFRAHASAVLSAPGTPFYTLLSPVTGGVERACVFPQAQPEDSIVEDVRTAPLIVETIILLRDLGKIPSLPLDQAGSDVCAGPALEPRPVELDTARAGFDRLTRREAEIVSQIAAGADLRAAALELRISPHTVRNHLKGIFRKLGVRSRAELLSRIILRERAHGRTLSG